MRESYAVIPGSLWGATDGTNWDDILIPVTFMLAAVRTIVSAPITSIITVYNNWSRKVPKLKKHTKTETPLVFS